MVEPKPTKIPRWNDLGANRTEPLEAEKDAGWAVNDQPPSGYFNWLQYYTGAHLTWMDERLLKGGLENDLTVTALVPDSSGAGGVLILQGGGANAAGKGGSVFVNAGAGSGGGFDGGDIDINAGNGPGDGGNVNIDAGDGTTNTGGEINIRAGVGGSGSEGGDVNIEAGDSVDINGGDISITGGSATGVDRGAGTVTFSTGDSTGGASGFMEFYAAEASTGGTAVVNTAVRYLSLRGGTGVKEVRTERFLNVENSTAVDPARGTARIVPKTPDPTGPGEGDLFVHDGTKQLAVHNGTRYHNLNQVAFNQIDTGFYGIDPGGGGPATYVLEQSPIGATTPNGTPLRHIIPANTLRAGSIIRIRAQFGMTDLLGGISPYESPDIWVGGVGSGPSPYTAPTGLQVFQGLRSADIWSACYAECEVTVRALAGANNIYYASFGYFTEAGPVKPTAVAVGLGTLTLSSALDVFATTVVGSVVSNWRVDMFQFTVDII